MKVIIFTDLDGSLLNHVDYSFAEAMPSLARIKVSGIPLIMTTSKTRREVEALQREMGVREPFIVENGGGIFFPSGYRRLSIRDGQQRDGYTLVALGTAYSRVREFLEKVSGRFNLRGFGDMDPAKIAELTGLTMESAAWAKEREFTEPFLMARSDDIGSLRATAAEEGLIVTSGGRFYHLMGEDQDKGMAVRRVLDIFRENIPAVWLSIGLGDSENDLVMLEQVDIPALIPRPGKGYLDIRLPGLLRAKEEGDRGWNEVVQRLLDECDDKNAAKES